MRNTLNIVSINVAFIDKSGHVDILLFPCSPIDAFDPDLKMYKKFADAHALEFDQLPGEMLLIPTGWFHQVHL